MFLSRYLDYTKIKGQLANAITITNLSFGIIAIILITKDLGHMSLVFIFLAALFDRFDGLVARHFHSESEFGKELDSLSDIVSFGVAPALLIYMTDLSSMLWVGIAATIFYIAAGAIRLARYNVKEFDGSFYGVAYYCSRRTVDIMLLPQSLYRSSVFRNHHGRSWFGNDEQYQNCKRYKLFISVINFTSPILRRRIYMSTGDVPKRLKGADSKSARAFTRRGGSNPLVSVCLTKLSHAVIPCGELFSCLSIGDLYKCLLFYKKASFERMSDMSGPALKQLQAHRAIHEGGLSGLLAN